MDFWDINSLTISELEELSTLQKIHGCGIKAMEIFMKENPGRIKNVGEIKDGEFIHNEITKDGVKETKGFEGIKKMLGDL